MDLPPNQTGIYELIHQPNQQRYTISIPHGYSIDEPSPLILALHWGGPRYPYMGKDFLLGLAKPALEELKAIIVAPDCKQDDWVNSESETDILELLTFLKDHYSLDPQRTLVTGYSLGGIGAWYLGAKHQDLFNGVLPISALPPSEAIEIQWNIPIYVIHSRQDEIFPFINTESYVNRIKTDGAPVTLVLLDDLPHFDTWCFIEPLHAALPWIKEIWSLNI